MEEILKGGNGESGVLLLDLGENDGVDTVNGSLVDLLFGNLCLDLLSELGGGGESDDVGVVTEEENLLLG